MSIKIVVRKDIELGEWRGMGGAITEASAYNFSKLSKEKQAKLIEAYYGKDGLDYRWGRVSIGSNDFCLKSYEYTKRADLSDFSIEHDEEYVLPMLRKILAKKDLQLIASPWSPPKNMKTTHMLRFGGGLKPWCYGRYARYIRMWLDAYAEKGVNFSFLTPQNEPHAIQIWESCMYSFAEQRRLAYKYLANELEDYDIQLLLWDHNKPKLPKVADKLLNGSYVTEYGRDKKVAGLCYHWYRGVCPDEMWAVREKYPDIMMVSSEMCCGFSPYNSEDWKNDGRLYYRELLSDINCGASAWVDWNILLSWNGGPSYCKNFVKSPVILNEAGDDFILTPIYDALKAFAKVFPVGSKVVRCECDSESVMVVARKVDKKYELVAVNMTGDKQEIDITCGKKNLRQKLDKFELKAIRV